MKSKKCEVCGKEIKGWNKKMLDWNYQIHIDKHKRDKSNSSTPNKSASSDATSFFNSSNAVVSGGASQDQEDGK